MSNNRLIPFNKPCLAGKELTYVADAVSRGHISGDGYYTKLCNEFLQTQLNVPKCLLTTSCTHALEMAAILCGIQKGDEVIVPSFTFTSTVNAFVLRGATPVFSDVRPDTINLNETLVERLITPRTKAIIPVHYAGVSCEMDKLCEIANRHGLYLIEDNAQGIFGKYKGKDLGTFGQFGTLSFHETKNINCGEGGALMINDPAWTVRAEVIREKGTNRSSFFRGEINKYGWVGEGSSYLPSDLLAAYLLAQLQASKNILEQRSAIWHRYSKGLRSWARRLGVQMPFVPEGIEQSYHMFYVVLPDASLRTNLISHLSQRGIKSVFHYQALNSSPMGLKLGGYKGQCPVSEAMSDRLLRLPFYNDLSPVDQDYVISAIESFSKSKSRGPSRRNSLPVLES